MDKRQSTQKDQKYAQISDFTLIKTLGSGANAKVKLGIKDQQRFAVKILKKATPKELKDVQHEINMLKELNHPNIVNLIEAGQAQYQKKNGKVLDKYYLVMELAEGGELFEYVSNTGPFTDQQCRYYFLQMLSALEHAHGKGICHRDLKPENILYDLNKNLKIADFGFATLIEGKQKDGYLKTVLGTESYMAPEIHNKQPYKGESVDLFASAIILFIMFAGTPPFSKASQNDPYYKLLVTKQNEKFWNAHGRFKSKGYYSQEFQDFMNKALAFVPEERMSLKEMKDHSFMKQKVSSPQEIQQEFTKRQNKVLETLEEERLKKQNQKEQEKLNKQNQQIKGFRAGSETKVNPFEAINQQYPQLSLQRQIQKINQDDIKQNDMITSQDPELVMRIIVQYLDEQKQQLKLNETKYKINCNYTENDGDSLNFDSLIFNLDEDLNVIHFERKDGDLIKFYNQVKDIQSYLTKRFEDLAQEAQQ